MSKPPISNISNIDLKDLDTDISAIKRSTSISNLGEKSRGSSAPRHHPDDIVIVSPNHIKPSYYMLNTSGGGHQRNNSNSNLFPIDQFDRLPPHGGGDHHMRTSSTTTPHSTIQQQHASSHQSTSLARISSISDENIAASQANKFKLNSVIAAVLKKYI